ncbi:GNAT family N-acetyltransferase [Streptomyces sp. NPDC091268]|uniref:GNAT family N-acetyltransferase n=1 Tax=Streptomyces sp. NPDC091268 TaxID=3365979 RepID=UPI0038228686
MNWKIERVEGASLDLDEVLEVYRASGLGERRPIEDRDRFRAMLDNANLVLVAREGGKLIGIVRSITDFSYVTYLSDIAVDLDHQRGGIGRALIEATQKETPGVKIVLLSAPAATGYYPRIGFTQHGSAWVLNP